MEKNVEIRRGLFQGHSLSPLLFVLSMIPLSASSKRMNAGYKWDEKEGRVNYLMLMDNVKLFGKNGKQVDSFVNTRHIFNTAIVMEFRFEKCGVLTLKRGKIVECD